MQQSRQLDPSLLVKPPPPCQPPAVKPFLDAAAPHSAPELHKGPSPGSAFSSFPIGTFPWGPSDVRTPPAGTLVRAERSRPLSPRAARPHGSGACFMLHSEHTLSRKSARRRAVLVRPGTLTWGVGQGALECLQAAAHQRDTGHCLGSNWEWCRLHLSPPGRTLDCCPSHLNDSWSKCRVWSGRRDRSVTPTVAPPPLVSCVPRPASPAPRLVCPQTCVPLQPSGSCVPFLGSLLPLRLGRTRTGILHVLFICLLSRSAYNGFS